MKRRHEPPILLMLACNLLCMKLRQEPTLLGIVPAGVTLVIHSPFSFRQHLNCADDSTFTTACADLSHL